MNREETRKAAEVMMAFCEGKPCEYHRREDVSPGKWRNMDGQPGYCWNWQTYYYRIKPQLVEVCQWAVLDTQAGVVVSIHNYRQGAEQYMLGRAHHKFLAIVELKGTYTCDT